MSSTPPPPPPGPVTIAVADLAERLGIDPADVEVVSTEEVTWRNGSRGCAERGTMYTQALIDGARITLGAGGTTYEYHSGGSGPPTLCENPTE
jgi:CO/xanthine dehydrogenase Mo-binding subunit